MKHYAKNLGVIISITVIGVFFVAILWMTYFGVTLLLETTIYRENPQLLPQGVLRNILAILVCVFVIFMMRFKFSDYFKAILMIAALTTTFIAIILHFYTIIWLAILVCLMIELILIRLILKQRKPWFYFYALGLSFLVALIYAWPMQ